MERVRLDSLSNELLRKRELARLLRVSPWTIDRRRRVDPAVLNFQDISSPKRGLER